ncbi:MAG TPA: DUF4124 domain-containing protein [Pseudomonadales bacterium]|nr:DUF4124 domain-containing protein [Pseudomonadales bacterium]
MLFLVSAPAGAADDYWVWVDQNGVTNYSEQPPEGIANARHVTGGEGRFGESERHFGERYPVDQPETPQPDATQPAANPSGGVNPDASIADQRAAIRAKIAETKQKNCEIGKRNLAQLEAYSQIRVKGDDGKEHVLSQEERQAQIDQAKQIIRSNCAG